MVFRAIESAKNLIDDHVTKFNDIWIQHLRFVHPVPHRIFNGKFLFLNNNITFQFDSKIDV